MNVDSNKERTTRYLGVQIVAFGVLVNGLILIIGSLLGIFLRRRFLATQFSIELNILVGLTLVYLSNLLWRRKHTAWIFTLAVYGAYIIIRFLHISDFRAHNHNMLLYLTDLLLPIIIFSALVLNRKVYTVKSDVRSFGVALRISLIVIIIAFCYGVVGFQLMDKSDFHHEISASESIHRTVDQFGLTTNSDLVPYTRRARVFLDSLNLISLAALTYVLISLFQPLKARFEDQTDARELTTRLLKSSHNNSEDFFKIWPQDKFYFFNKTKTAGIAFNVHRGIALIVGDPFGAVAEFKSLIIEFTEYCRINDWKPSFIHTEEHFNPLYSELNFMQQKIGEEAIVNASKFTNEVSKTKYFRNIDNKFKKQGYQFEVLKPPHSEAILERLRDISNDWLTKPGRSERTFMMGYFTDRYMQQCNILVLKDESSVIQTFLNQIPSFDKDEANYDLLRHSSAALGNSNDYLLMNFIKHIHEQGIKHVNMGLCPLKGLDKNEEDRSIIDAALSFLYSNGDRLYSFSGLVRFKQKYEPEWKNRYLVYKNGISGFTRTVTALNVGLKLGKFQRTK